MERRRPLVYVFGGMALGMAYALLNTQTDAWARAGDIGRVFVAFHGFVDRGIPLLAGGLLGLAVHWMQLRTQMAREETRRAEELRSRLRHVEREQTAFLVAASTLHELKNPLHALGLLVDELAEIAKTADAATLDEQIQRVRAQMDRTLVPLDALRALTRRGPEERGLRALGPIAESVVASLTPLAAERGILLRLEGDLEATANVDTEFVRIILDNLILNAFESGDRQPAPKAVCVHVRRQDNGRVVLRVSDDGPGISSDVPDVFAPLASSKSGGLGLGLPIAKALATSLGGELSLAKDPQYRTTFECALPGASA
ncbi:MAG: HAMP domain-containing sensor histidine kinase [Polyangiaceae bacterium]